MIRSMTGFGEADGGAARRTPPGHGEDREPPLLQRPPQDPLGLRSATRAEIQQWLKNHFSRGHVNLTLTLESDAEAGAGGPAALDLDRARHYRALLGTLRAELDLSGEVGCPASVLRFGDIFQCARSAGEGWEVDPARSFRPW